MGIRNVARSQPGQVVTSNVHAPLEGHKHVTMLAAQESPAGLEFSQP